MDTNISNLILKLTIATYLMKKKKIDFVILKMNDLIDFRKLIDIFRIQETLITLIYSEEYIVIAKNVSIRIF